MQARPILQQPIPLVGSSLGGSALPFSARSRPGGSIIGGADRATRLVDYPLDQVLANDTWAGFGHHNGVAAASQR